MTDLIALHATFWEFRRTMEPYWTTPDMPDAARFAKTEAAEVLKTNGLWEAFVAFAASRQAQIKAADALDAVLRQNISYSRNTVRNMDERNELGDLAMMLLTAMGPAGIVTGELPAQREGRPTPTVDTIANTVGNVHEAATENFPLSTVRSYALRSLDQIDRYPGVDLSVLLHARMNRIFRKHHPDGQRPAKEAGHNGNSGGAWLDVADLGEEHNVSVHRNETPGVYRTDDYAGYHPE